MRYPALSGSVLTALVALAAVHCGDDLAAVAPEGGTDASVDTSTEGSTDSTTDGSGGDGTSSDGQGGDTGGDSGGDAPADVITDAPPDASHCTDGIKDVDETDVDCGGAVCPKCATGLGCLMASDCQSGVCKNNMKCQ